MSPEPQNRRSDMPMAGRIVSAGVGAFLVIGGIIMVFLAARPLNWKVCSAGLGGIGLGADLLHGAIRGRWPVSAFLWLIP